MKEFVLNISNEFNPKEKDEFISSLCFDVMFAIQQGSDSVFLKSQGKAIPICADLALEIERRLTNQMVPIKKKIFLNSKFLYEKKSKYNKHDKKQSNSFGNKPKMISYMDVKFYFKH